jgi:hypothetical protein
MGRVRGVSGDTAEGGDALPPIPPLVNDVWPEENLYESVPEENKLELHFTRLTVHGTTALRNVSVQLYLDDTSNGKDGTGNTRLVRLTREANANENKGMHVAGVRWVMTGASPVGSGQDPVKMPLVAKAFVSCEAGGQHCTVGGSAFSLEELVNSNATGSSFWVPIFNSFTREVQHPSLAEQLAAAGCPKTIAKQCEGALVVLEFENTRENALEQSRAFQTKKSRLFRKSQLMAKDESAVLSMMLPAAINSLWISRVVRGRYACPENMEYGAFAKMTREEQSNVLNEEEGVGMFRQGHTPNARLDGYVYPHVQSSLPGMHDEGEQPGLTNKRALLHAFHAAMATFCPYGWDIGSYMKRVAEGGTETQPKGVSDEVMSFLGFMLGTTHSLPGTQKYVSDYWSFPNPFAYADTRMPWMKVGDWHVLERNFSTPFPSPPNPPPPPPPSTHTDGRRGLAARKRDVGQVGPLQDVEPVWTQRLREQGPRNGVVVPGVGRGGGGEGVGTHPG